VASAIVYLLGYSLYLMYMWRRLGMSGIIIDPRFAFAIWKASGMLLIARIASVLRGNMEPAIAAMLVSPVASATLVLIGRLALVTKMFLDRIGSSLPASRTSLADRNGMIRARSSAISFSSRRLFRHSG